MLIIQAVILDRNDFIEETCVFRCHLNSYPKGFSGFCRSFDPVCIDIDDQLNKLNKFPADITFQTFLLDKDNKVAVLGNPVHCHSLTRCAILFSFSFCLLWQEKSSNTSVNMVRFQAFISFSKS